MTLVFLVLTLILLMTTYFPAMRWGVLASEVIPVAGAALFGLFALVRGRTELVGHIKQNSPLLSSLAVLLVYALFLTTLSVMGGAGTWGRLLSAVFIGIPLGLFLLPDATLGRFREVLLVSLHVLVALTGIVAVLQVLTPLSVPWFPVDGWRARGMLRGTLGLSGMLGVLLAFLLLNPRYWLLNLVSFPLGLAALVLTQSRGSWMALAIGCLLSLAVHPKLLWNSLKKRLPLALIVGGSLVVVLVAAVCLAPEALKSSLLDRLASVLNWKTDGGNTGRLGAWGGGWEGLLTAPWGNGLGLTGFGSSYVQPTGPHFNFESFWLELAYGVGLASLLFFVPLVTTWYKNYHRKDALSLATTAVMVVILVQNSVQPSLETPVTMTMVFLVVRFLALGSPAKPEKGRETP